jgi:uncharacterized FlaG/YvyC family protein
MKQLTEKEAISIAESKIWEKWTNEEIVRFQLFQDRLCMNFSRFHEAMEKVLNRSIYTDEFGYRDKLVEEYLGIKEAPTFEEIINLIPKEKQIIILQI